MSAITIAKLHQRFSGHEPVRADLTGRIEAAVAIVLAPRVHPQLDILLIKRAELEGDPWSGQMALPGGRREDGDATLLATARRETFEETGVALADSNVVGVLDDLAPVNPVLPPIVVRPFVFSLPERPPITPSDEVALHLWTPLDDLPQSIGRTDILLRGVQRSMPAFFVGPHTVWGMTHRILKSLFELAM
ncbi:MAG: CoA pyrophosphatase [Gemmatimonadota bacterium]|nr:CoA pyrophosphatase [Gemmatimonadota bacterium]